MVICKFVFASSHFVFHLSSLYTAEGEVAEWAAGCWPRSTPAFFVLADHLQIEKGLSSDIYYRENQYIEKLYLASMQDLSKAELTSAF